MSCLWTTISQISTGDPLIKLLDRSMRISIVMEVALYRWMVHFHGKIPSYKWMMDTRWGPPQLCERWFINHRNSIDIPSINHSEIGIMCTNLAMNRSLGHHLAGVPPWLRKPRRRFDQAFLKRWTREPPIHDQITEDPAVKTQGVDGYSPNKNTHISWQVGFLDVQEAHFLPLFVMMVLKRSQPMFIPSH